MSVDARVDDNSIVATTNQSADPFRVGIIGGGITGLTAAYDLVNNPRLPASKEVVIYEGSSHLGGLAAGFRGRPEWDWPLEHFYHHLFTNDKDIISLTNEIGLSNQLSVYSPITAMYMQGELHALDSPLRVLRFPHIPVADRLRMGMAIAYLRYHPARPWRRFDRIVADKWLRKWMGRNAYETVWRPMLQGKFGDEYVTVNLAWFWARVYKRTKELAYYDGGFQAFVDQLGEAAVNGGAVLRLVQPVKQIARTDNGRYRIITGDGESEIFDVILSTVSPELMTRLAPDLPENYRSTLTSLKSHGAVVLTVALDRQLMESVYWANIPKAAGLPFLALVEHTNMIDPSHYDGDHLLYIGNYLEPDHRYFSMSAEELLAEFSPHLTAFNSRYDESWVQGAWVHKARYAQPVPPVSYADQIPDVRTPLQGLYFASMSQVYPWDRGTNYAVEMGRKVASMLVEDYAAAINAG